MKAGVVILGTGYSLGSKVVSNTAVATSLGLSETWFTEHTGVLERRCSSSDETVVDLAAEAVRSALHDAGIATSKLGKETVLVYIQNGLTHLAPPPVILLCRALGLRSVRPFGLDGVCSEAINAIEIAAMMLSQGNCERCIVAASGDFLPLIDPQDIDTVGLFGAGAGALIMERSPDPSSGIFGLQWASDNNYWDLGMIPILDQVQRTDGINILVGYYQMKGAALARVALKTIPSVLTDVLNESGWAITDIARFITHQPNVKFLQVGARSFGIPYDRIEVTADTTGNLGPASVFVSLAIARESRRIITGDKIMLVSFGLGFSCGAAAIIL